MLYWPNANIFDVRIPYEDYGIKQFKKLEFRWIKRTQ